MRKIIWLLIIILFLWNSFLMLEMDSMKRSLSLKSTQTPTIVSTTVHGYSTDLTKIISDNDAKMVEVKIVGSTLGTVRVSGYIYWQEAQKVYVGTIDVGSDPSATITVTFASGESFPASLVARDKVTDLSLLVIESDMRFDGLVVSDSDIVKKGSYVVAMGHSLVDDTTSSVSFGVISTTHKTMKVDSDGDGTSDSVMISLASDVKMTPVMNGGLVFNGSGEVVGMLSSRLSNDVNFISIVPINEIRLVFDSMIQTGDVHRLAMGLIVSDIQAMPLYTKGQLGLPLDQMNGLYVNEVLDGGLAKLSGINVGDILVKWNNEDIISFKNYRQALYSELGEYHVMVRKGDAYRDVIISGKQ